MVQQIDVYDLLLHGIRSDLQRLQSGDTIRVPPIGPQVRIEGMVRRPAIYELNAEKNLAEVLELSGGVLSSGTLRHVDVERIVAHQNRTMLRLDIPESDNPQAVDQALTDFRMKTAIRWRFRPSCLIATKRFTSMATSFGPVNPYRDGRRCPRHRPFLQRFTSRAFVEPRGNHSFGSPRLQTSRPHIQPAGRARRQRAEHCIEALRHDSNLWAVRFQEAPIITVTGEVRDPGDHLTNGVTHLRDAVLAGGVAPDADLNDAQVFRKTADGKLRVINVSLAKALEGDERANIALDPTDRVFIHRSQSKSDPPRVTIQGEVERPGKYPLGEGMSAADLVRVAGGFKRSADTRVGDLTSYMQEEGRKLRLNTITLTSRRQ